MQWLKHLRDRLGVAASVAAMFLAVTLGCLVPVAQEAWAQTGVIAVEDLPPEARQVLQLIHEGGPFPYAKDGTVFGNYERVLPKRPRGYYREFTVPTPGLKNRGPRRIVAGQGAAKDISTSGEYWYTADHYNTFSRIRE